MNHYTAVVLTILAMLLPYRADASLGKHFMNGTGGAFTGENRWIWLTGGTLTLVAFKYDKDIYLHYANKEKEEFPDSVGDTMGTGIPGAALALVTMGVGWTIGSDRTLGAGQSHAEALIATFVYTSILKIAVERDRPPTFSPNESAFNASFPSGHTSTAFATAGSVMASTGPLLGLPVFVLAAITGYSRIQQRAHYAGDVIFGATLGYTMGTGFYKHHTRGKSLTWNFLPYLEDRENWGIVAQHKF